jgi:hypothetical protein
MAPPNEPNIAGNGATPTPITGGGSRLAKMTREATSLSVALAGVARSLDAITAKGTKAAAALKGINVGAIGGVTTGVAQGSQGHPVLVNSGPASTTSSNTNYSLDPAASGGNRRMSAMEIMQQSRGGAFTSAAMAIGNVVGAGVAAMDSRIARGYEYSSSADKMSVMYQQITGLSNAGVRNAYRQPLTNYRLGTNGINALMGMQASTGISALGNASTVEGLNALSGYSLGAEGVTNMLTSLGSAQTTNRMFMMTGQSLYMPGGGQRSGTEVIQNLARASGLTNLRNPGGALQQGSNTRSRLADMGIDSATQDIVIQYAMANQQYAAKGGKGMYDPSSKSQREFVGIEDNFATQIEETTRVKTGREEDFYGRQQDNFAKLEKTTQSLERAFGDLEDRLSGIVGKAIETKPQRKATGGVLKALGPAAMMAGAAISTTGVGAAVGVPLMILGGLATAFGGAMDGPAGDPGPGRNLPSMGKTGDPNTSGVTGKMHPTMQQRVDQLIAASGGKVGLGTGYRSKAAQETMFRSRYRKTSSPVDAEGKKNWEWDGSYWEHVSGAQAAPPGRSMHEIGLAADLTGDMSWVTANAARFGLKHFESMGEPWHVQPSELPNGRTEYEKQGRPWGGEPMSSGGVSSGRTEHTDDAYGGGGTTNAGVTTASFAGMSMADAISAFRASGFLGSTGLSGGKGSPRRRGGVGSSTMPTKSGGQLTGEDVARYAYNAGFRGENLVKAVAIAYRESRWNAGSYNPNASTKDLSYGLMQINMIGALGPSRLKQFGLSSNEELYDPAINMKAAFQMSGGKDFYAWGPYKGKDALYSTNPEAARQAVINAGFSDTGDPDLRTSSRGSGMSVSTLTTGATFNIAPVINVNGSDNPQADAQIIAREVTMIIEREMRLRNMRNA